MLAVKIENLTYVYSPDTPFQKTALKNINLQVKKGEFIGIIGHTGSGKSSLIQHINGILKPTSGKVVIDGQDIFENKISLSKVRKKVGLVFQYPEYQLFEETIYKDIAFGPKNLGCTNDEIKERVYKAIEFVGLPENILLKSPFDISGGQKRRVAIAGILAMNPSILILDEPTAGLDPRGRVKILKSIREYHEKTQNTVMLVSHNMEDIAMYADKILVMNKGKIFLFDTVKNIFSNASNLEQIGLTVPSVTKIFLKLKEKGYTVPTDIFTVDQATDYIVKKIKGGV